MYFGEVVAQEPISNPDVNNTDLEYWNKVLKSHGLGVDAGNPKIEHDGRRRLVYVGADNELVRFTESRNGKRRKGRGPDA